MYLLFLSSNQILPFVYWLCKVYRVHGDLDLANDVMFTKTVKVKHLQHQSLTTQLAIWYLGRHSILTKGELQSALDTFKNVTNNTIKHGLHY